MHARMSDCPYAANRFLAVTSKLFSWAAERGLLPDGHVNPAAKIKRYREPGRERFLTSDELARLGSALRTVAIDPFPVAAIRLLILTGARLREILHVQWRQIDIERGVNSCRIVKQAGSLSFSTPRQSRLLSRSPA
jgi:integrase